MFLKMGGVGLFFLMMIVLPAVSAQDCIYNGRKYRTGAKLANICADMTCVKGKWNATGIINKVCALCRISGDPNIVTFDQYSYDWNGQCNYSIAQPNFGFNEKFGIYVQFNASSNNSYGYETTFTDNPNTVIEINHASLPDVTVNGAPYKVTSTVTGLPVGSTTQPVLAWMLGECVVFLGSQGLMLMACPNQIYVWAYTSLKRQLNGLCGRYTSVQTDDFTDRTNNAHPLETYPVEFPESWMTAQQSDSECKPGDVCVSDEARQENIANCTSWLADVKWEKNSPTNATLQQAIYDCATELCKLEGNEDGENAVKDMVKEMLQNDIMVEVKTKKI